METLHPGLFLQEVPSEKPIEGTSTSTGAFVGVAEKGPIGKSELVTSWAQFVEKYGSYIPNSYLAYAVRGFFENGGTRAYISRVVHRSNGTKTSSKATSTIKAGAENALIVDALYDGAYGNNIEVEIASNTSDKTVDFTVYDKGVQVEKYEDVIFAELSDVVNSRSKYVKVTVIDEDTLPNNGRFSLQGGNDGLVGLTGTDYVEALKAFDNDPINLLAIPGVTDVSVLTGAKDYAENRKDVFVIAEVPLGRTVTGARYYKTTEANIASTRVALYYPWIKVADPIGAGKNPTKLIPPSGHLMGIYARIDNTRGVYKAPAGTEAQVRGAIGLEYNVSDAEQDLLNPIGVNVIRAFAGEGIIVWGARTTDVKSEYKYIPVRRSIDYIEQSILAGTRWSVFEPNDNVLWAKLTASIEAFLRGFWRAGGLKGTDEKQAFQVECNENTTTPDDIEAGRVYANIGVAPQKPAEFIIFRVSLRK